MHHKDIEGHASALSVMSVMCHRHDYIPKDQGHAKTLKLSL